MSGEARGRTAEIRLMAELAGSGWLCGSRRHLAGPGDVLAVRSDRMPMLIEVKTTAKGPWERFGPKDRNRLRSASAAVGAEPVVAWKPPRARAWKYIRLHEWPAVDHSDAL